MRSLRQRGFTLIEAAVAIAVVAILSGIIVPLVLKIINDSQRARALNDVQIIAAAVASQLKDTGSRPVTGGPSLPNGGGPCNGTADLLWRSGPPGATNAGGLGALPPAGNSLVNLFTAPKTDAIATMMFGFGINVGAEFSYKGPYLSTDVALKQDPWGTPYYLLGYNNNGKNAGTPIWVLCCGPDKTTNNANATATSAALPATWNQTLANCADDIAVRVN